MSQNPAADCVSFEAGWLQSTGAPAVGGNSKVKVIPFFFVFREVNLGFSSEYPPTATEPSPVIPMNCKSTATVTADCKSAATKAPFAGFSCQLFVAATSADFSRQLLVVATSPDLGAICFEKMPLRTRGKPIF